MEPELIADYGEDAGEGPLWHVGEQRVYWVDITTSRIFRYHPASGQHELFYQGEEDIGGYTFQADGSLLLFMARGAIKVLRDGQLNTIIEDIPAERETRFNDVIADPAGRVYCGTMPTKGDDARLYRLDTDGTLTVVFEGISLSNGMGFTLDRKQMYYTDSFRRVIYLFDYEQDTGALSGQRLFMRVPEDDEVLGPDGMTVDAEGCVWSALWGSSSIVRFRPDGTEERRVQIPGAKRVSSLIFGGANMTDIYVTTQGANEKEEAGPGAGAFYRVNVGIRGLPDFHSSVLL
ncbi:MAG: gluconolaconase [Dehalococcoidia bacterium]|nr:gluconolaconase [Dehalococcoidia bacterium]